MAIDGQPAEPFQARNGALVLAPGGRVDVFIDVTSAARYFAPQILLHDGKAGPPDRQVIVSSEPPSRPAPLPPPRRCPPTACRSGSTSRTRSASISRSAVPECDWVTPSQFAATAPPAFRAKAGRTVVLALTNRAAIATVFHLHGHHFRLLDRLDDGWKPFWLDTLAIEPGQTQRIAFRGRICRALSDRIRRHRLGRAAAGAVVRCRVRRKP